MFLRWFRSQGHLGTPRAKGRSELLAVRRGMGVNPRGPLARDTHAARAHTRSSALARIRVHVDVHYARTHARAPCPF